jgi:hypothetical protein
MYSIEKRKCENGDYGGRKATKKEEIRKRKGKRRKKICTPRRI